MQSGWNNCSCSTIYTDAWGQPIIENNDMTPVGSCAPNWGLIALIVAAGFLGSHMGSSRKTRAA